MLRKFKFFKDMLERTNEELKPELALYSLFRYFSYGIEERIINKFPDFKTQ